MIDFRYHLVSLVSVFLALAVGIVLGAGPLEGEIGDQLNTQVAQLRAEKEDLRTEVETSKGAVSNRDDFTRAIAPALVRQQLGGESVLVVTLPGADTDAVKPLTETLRAAGARVVGRIDVKTAWTDPGRADDRESTVRSLGAVASASAASPAAVTTTGVPSTPSGTAVAPSTTVRIPVVEGATSDSTALTGLLARATVTKNLAETGSRDAVADRLLDGLRKHGLIGVDGDLSGRATEVIVLVPGVQTSGGDQPTTSAPGAGNPLAQWSALTVGLDARSDGSVVVGPASSATEGGLIASLRAQAALAGTVSTVDTGGTPMGDISTVYALREQSLGGAGSYGFVGKVKARVPVLAEVSGS